MSLGTIYILAMAAGGSFLLLAFTLWLWSRERPVPNRAERVDGEREIRIRAIHMVRGQEDITELQRQLAQAGFVHPAAPTLFIILKVFSGALVATLGGFAITALPFLSRLETPLRLGLVVLLFSFGFLAPSYWIERRRQRYKQRIERALPDVLDLLQICVEAGQSLDQGFVRVGRELAGMHPELAAHFSWAAEAIAAGMEREEALMNIVHETESEDIRALVTTLLQSGRLGTPVSQTLSVYVEDLRDRRLRWIEEKTNVLPTKMTLGTMLFTVPPLLILLLTPAIIRLKETL